MRLWAFPQRPVGAGCAPLRTRDGEVTSERQALCTHFAEVAAEPWAGAAAMKGASQHSQQAGSARPRTSEAAGRQQPPVIKYSFCSFPGLGELLPQGRVVPGSVEEQAIRSRERRGTSSPGRTGRGGWGPGQPC